MKLRWILVFVVVAMAAFFAPASSRAQVHDGASIFSKDAVDQANQDLKQTEKRHGKQFVVETFASVPDDQKAAAKDKPEEFFRKWMATRAKDLKVNGVYALICMDPHHMEVGAGTNTVKRGDFTEDDVAALRKRMQSDLHDKEYDKALANAVESVEKTYTANIHEPVNHAAANRDSEYSHGRYNPAYSTVSPNNPGPNLAPVSNGLLGGFGSLICFAVAVIVIISLIRSVFRGGSGGGYGGGNSYGNQGYTGGNFGGGMGYGSGMMGGGGGGSGFGKGFLGGLLGGAIGGYAADKFDHRNDQGNSGFFGGGGQQSDNSGGGGSSSFDSGPSDAGGGFGDSSSGGDFGGGGGDSGGGGGDSGGGSSGGDF